MNKDQILGILRHVLTFVGGIIVAKGYADDTNITELIGGLLTVTGAVWSIIAKRKAGGTPALPLILFCALLSALCLGVTGCGAVKPHGNVDVNYGNDGTVTAGTGLDIGTNATVVATGGYNTATGAWTAGISIVFKDAPSAETIAYLAKAGAVVRSREAGYLEYLIPQFNRQNPAQLEAIEAALKAGATLRGI